MDLDDVITLFFITLFLAIVFSAGLAVGYVAGKSAGENTAYRALLEQHQILTSIHTEEVTSDAK